MVHLNEFTYPDRADSPTSTIVVERVVTKLPKTDAITAITGAIEAAKFAATAAEIFPNLIIYTFLEAFPDNHDEDIEEFNRLGLKRYLTNISSSLVGDIYILPVFDFVIANDPGPDDTFIEREPI